MAGEWQSVRFEQVCEHSAFGPRFAGELYATDGNVATLRTTDISTDGQIEYDTMPLARLDLERFQQHVLQINDLVITRSGRIGTAALFKGFRLPVLPGAFLIRFRLRHDIADPNFYRYFFNSPPGQGLLASVATGSVQQNINITSVHRLEVPLPPLSQQRAIAYILATLDDKIELNQRMNETLEAMAWAIFKSWFVDFDPVRAKVEGRDPGLPKKIADLFPDRFEDSELEEIPAGWRVGTIDEEFNLTMGQSPPGETYNEANEGLPFYQGRADFGFRFPIQRVFCTAPTRFADAGDTLISVRAPVGDINMAVERCCIGRGVAAARHKSGSRSYTYYFMQAIEEVFNRFEAEGTVFGSITKKDFHQIQRIMPPIELVHAFERFSMPIDSKIANNDQQTQNLAALRDTLLPKLISGELRVPDVNRIIGRGNA